jgi:hypothetical protein
MICTLTGNYESGEVHVGDLLERMADRGLHAFGDGSALRQSGA